MYHIPICQLTLVKNKKNTLILTQIFKYSYLYLFAVILKDLYYSLKKCDSFLKLVISFVKKHVLQNVFNAFEIALSS